MIKTQLQQALVNGLSHLQQQDVIPDELDVDIQIERTRNKEFGDYATNIAMLLAKPARQNPRQLAELLIEALHPITGVDKIEIAGPGFINFYLSQNLHTDVLQTVLQQQRKYGHSQYTQDQTLHIEIVSANPTGPLHVGHGRLAAIGASVANLLEAIGYQVHREYYVNDAGRQMDILAVSVFLRYLQLSDAKITFPSNAYQGDYIREISAQITPKLGTALSVDTQLLFDDLPADAPEGDKEVYIDALIVKVKALLGEDTYAKLHQVAVESVLNDIKSDLAEFGVEIDNWFSEKQLHQSDAIENALNRLRLSGHTYEQNGALWFKSTDFTDEKDRVLVRQNGQATYLTPDIAYHYDKFDRGFNKVVDCMGADHHGYIPRLKASLAAQSLDPSRLEVVLIQFVILYRQQQKVPMSTRSGSFITLRELRQEVGKDATRFFYIMRKPEQHLDFDLDLATEKSNENPVYYIQYAHARISRVFEQLASSDYPAWDQDLALASTEELTEQHEQSLLDSLTRYPEIIHNAAIHHEPHLLGYYLRELANQFHSYYNAHPFLVEKASLRSARLGLIKAVQIVIQNGLSLLGVSAPDTM